MELRPEYPVVAERLALRPLVDADVGAIVSYRSLPEVCRYVPFEPMDDAAVRERIGGIWSRRVIEVEGQFLLLGVELLESGLLVGDVLLLWRSALHLDGEVGYVLNPAFSGNGYMTEAVHRVLHLAFDELGLRRVIARVDAENVASANLLHRLGLRLEARLVENEWFKGRWSDELGFAMLSREWRGQHESGCPDFSARSRPPSGAR